jgi:hypothetical protein
MNRLIGTNVPMSQVICYLIGTKMKIVPMRIVIGTNVPMRLKTFPRKYNRLSSQFKIKYKNKCNKLKNLKRNKRPLVIQARRSQ